MKFEYSVVEALAKSQVYQDYVKAFIGATGLSLNLRPLDARQLANPGTGDESECCAIMARNGRSCAHCLRVQRKLRQKAAARSYTMVCGAGISETAVPVRCGEKLVGFLHTGQVLLTQPTATHFGRTTKVDDGVDVDASDLRSPFLGTRVLSPRQYASAVGLLRIFAEHLSMVSNQLLVQGESAEPVVVTRAKQFIQAHYQEPLSLGQVAKVGGLSKFCFCKLFGRVTGLGFTAYLSSVRIEKAKNLLLNRNLRISEIGYEVGFQSLTHFNRVFKSKVGRSPTSFRDSLPSAGIGICRRLQTST